MSNHSEVLNRMQSGEWTEDPISVEEEEKAAVKNKGINWEQAASPHADSKEISKFAQLEKRDLKDQVVLFEENGGPFARLFMTFLYKFNSDEDRKYILTLLDDLLIEAAKSKNFRKILDQFYNLHKTWKDPTLPASPFGPLFSVLDKLKEDAYSLTLASRILCTLIVHHPNIAPETVENAFVFFVDDVLANTPPPSSSGFERKINVALNSLRVLFGVNAFRKLFVNSTRLEDGLSVLMHFITYEDRIEEITIGKNPNSKKKQARGVTSAPEDGKKKGPNFQLIYEAVYCLWCLSFNKEVKEKLVDPKLIYNLCHIVKRCTNKVKVIRVTLATLNNLLGVGKNNELMYSYGLLTSLNLLKQKRWGDEELENDIKEVEQSLEKDVDELTSWDRYKNEVLAQNLEWSPAHKSAKFWQENYMKFEEEDYLVLRNLEAMLTNSNNLQVLAIACWDIGEFVRVHPQGKRICDRLQLKVPIMKLLSLGESKDGPVSEETQQVTKEALTALQKLMITNWEYLQ